MILGADLVIHRIGPGIGERGHRCGVIAGRLGELPSRRLRTLDRRTRVHLRLLFLSIICQRPILLHVYVRDVGVHDTPLKRIARRRPIAPAVAGVWREFRRIRTWDCLLMAARRHIVAGGDRLPAAVIRKFVLGGRRLFNPRQIARRHRLVPCFRTLSNGSQAPSAERKARHGRRRGECNRRRLNGVSRRILMRRALLQSAVGDGVNDRRPVRIQRLRRSDLDLRVGLDLRTSTRRSPPPRKRIACPRTGRKRPVGRIVGDVLRGR